MLKSQLVRSFSKKMILISSKSQFLFQVTETKFSWKLRKNETIFYLVVSLSIDSTRNHFLFLKKRGENFESNKQCFVEQTGFLHCFRTVFFWKKTNVHFFPILVHWQFVDSSFAFYSFTMEHEEPETGNERCEKNGDENNWMIQHQNSFKDPPDESQQPNGDGGD